MKTANRSKKISLGFRVVNTQTGEVLSKTFSRRAPALAIACDLRTRHPGLRTGVQKVEEYVPAGLTREEALTWLAAQQR